MLKILFDRYSQSVYIMFMQFLTLLKIKGGFSMAVQIEKTRVNLNFPSDLLKRVDEYAESVSINRTAAIMVLLNQALDSRKALDDISELATMMKNHQQEMEEIKETQ